MVSNYALSRPFSWSAIKTSDTQQHGHLCYSCQCRKGVWVRAHTHTPMAPWCSASLIRCSTCLFCPCADSTGWKSFLRGLSLVSNTLLERKALLPTQRGYRDSRLPYSLPKWVVLWGMAEAQVEHCRGAHKNNPLPLLANNSSPHLSSLFATPAPWKGGLNFAQPVIRSLGHWWWNTGTSTQSCVCFGTGVTLASDTQHSSIYSIC